MIALNGKVVKMKRAFAYSLFLPPDEDKFFGDYNENTVDYISAIVGGLARSHALCFTVCASLQGVMCGSHKAHAQDSCCLCVEECVELMLRDSEIISALPRKPLVRQQLSQHTCTLLISFCTPLSPILSSINSTPLFSLQMWRQYSTS